jgi:hypothetical protein
VVAWARANDVVVASDECYAELGWTGEHVPSILDPGVCGGSHEGLLAVYSLSKQSNLAGYRAAFVAGDVRLVRALLEVRKHAGMMVPWPVQVALTAALGDDAHVAEQKARYAARRQVLREAVESFGLRVDHSDAGLYLWATRGEDAGATVEALPDGIRVAMADRPRCIDVVTLPFPGFPTDLQPMAVALAAVSTGTALITENVYDGRFMFVNELVRLGADIRIDGHHAVVRGRERLSSAPVVATDIRAGAGLVLAGLVSDGVTEVQEVHHVDRGYPDFVDQLRGLGAKVTRTGRAC